MPQSNLTKEEVRSTWGKLLRYTKNYLPALVIAMICSIIGTIFSIVGPRFMGNMTDVISVGLTSSVDISAVVSTAYKLVSFYIVSIILTYVQSWMMTTITQKISRQLRADISTKINRLPLKYFDRVAYGDVLSRVTNDVDTIGMSMNQSIAGIIGAIVTFVGTLTMMLLMNISLTLIAVGCSLVGFVLMNRIVRVSRKYFMEQQTALGAINGHIEEVFSAHNIVKVYNAEKVNKSAFDSINNRLYDVGWRAGFLGSLMMPLMGVVGNIGFLAVIIFGSSMVMNGSLTFGVVVAFMQYVRMFTQPLNQIGQSMSVLQQTAAAAKRVFELLDQEELIDEHSKTTALTEIKGEVDFSHVKFGYNEDRLIIKDFTAHARAGQKIAIVGPTGAGKTTLVNLLMRFYELNEGAITIDGINITDITRENLHDLFCMVLQDAWLFEGTIRRNIIYNKEGVTEEDMITACKAAGIHHFIQTLPEGYDTVLKEESSLSAGQKQLMTIARAIIKGAPLLILDEATSSVDTRTEVLIQNAMDQLMSNRTSFIIAHRLSTIKNADLILVIDEGDIVEQGTHKELLEKEGFYAKLYNSQFEEAAI
jgi:ATP-binding cassette subfamily B protein